MRFLNRCWIFRIFTISVWIFPAIILLKKNIISYSKFNDVYIIFKSKTILYDVSSDILNPRLCFCYFFIIIRFYVFTSKKLKFPIRQIFIYRFTVKFFHFSYHTIILFKKGLFFITLIFIRRISNQSNSK